MRGVTAYDLSSLMEHKSLNLHEAAEDVIHNRIKKMNGDGGLIAVDSKGNLALEFNTEGMYRAFKNSHGTEVISIYKD